MPRTAIVLLAEGFEEVEAIGPIDVLRRAGVRVTVVGVSGLTVKSSRGIGVQAEVMLADIRELPDAVIVPGGMPGSTHLANSEVVGEFLKKMHAHGKMIAAICAAPAVVLAPLGILDGKKATCYPGCESDFTEKISYEKKRVVLDGRIITSQGPGTALEFALQIVGELVGYDMAAKLREKMLVGV
ncbi:MAG TPA: DJ-1/PfpI family protein [Candidatus Omnitrophota bacterium]|nr:DJ-1/PfpI family protein [Candidatus Omnitrophota bacterium]HPS37413.1 DJ-1/PfpI family protein [Candidatus Omnitrophota bacterium]